MNNLNEKQFIFLKYFEAKKNGQKYLNKNQF